MAPGIRVSLMLDCYRSLGHLLSSYFCFRKTKIAEAHHFRRNTWTSVNIYAHFAYGTNYGKMSRKVNETTLTSGAEISIVRNTLTNVIFRHIERCEPFEPVRGNNDLHLYTESVIKCRPTPSHHQTNTRFNCIISF